jgi:hypothetical protein
MRRWWCRSALDFDCCAFYIPGVGELLDCISIFIIIYISKMDVIPKRVSPFLTRAGLSHGLSLVAHPHLLQGPLVKEECAPLRRGGSQLVCVCYSSLVSFVSVIRSSVQCVQHCFSCFSCCSWFGLLIKLGRLIFC